MKGNNNMLCHELRLDQFFSPTDRPTDRPNLYTKFELKLKKGRGEIRWTNVNGGPHVAEEHLLIK